jgi:hypothetical protein
MAFNLSKVSQGFSFPFFLLQTFRVIAKLYLLGCCNAAINLIKCYSNGFFLYRSASKKFFMLNADYCFVCEI